jgi:pilus assembly protein Flp/PilA
MRKVAKKIRWFLVSTDGPTAVEYAIMLGLIIVICVLSIALIGTKTNTLFERCVW